MHIAMSKIIANKPWKKWATRKFSFIYCMVVATVIIGIGAYACFHPELNFDFAAWMEESMSFLKWVVGTGTLITILPLNDVVKIFKGGDE